MLGLGSQIFGRLNRTFRARLSLVTQGGKGLPAAPLPTRSPRTSPARATAELPELRSAIERAVAHLFDLQEADGFWEGRVYDNVTITAEYVMLLKFLDLLDDGLREKAKRTMLDGQLRNGGWAIYRGGPSDHSATIEAYFALKLCGLTGRHPAMTKARELILRHGGIQTSRVFTKIHLALFGEYPWSGIPTINPELMLLPKQAPIHIYEFSSWSRAVIIPLLVIFDRKPVRRLPPSLRIGELDAGQGGRSTRQELQKWLKEPRVDLEGIFAVGQRALHLYEMSPVKPLRRRALRMAEKWILDHQDPKGNWGGIFPAMANSIVALHLTGYPMDHPVIRKGLKMLRSFAEETPETFRMQSTVSPVWDTAIAAYALSEAGLPADDPRLARSLEWLISLQILDVRGDWRFKAKPRTRPGGWPFEHENDQYPDIDDTALAILSLLPAEGLPKADPRVTESIHRGLEWMAGMQGSDGGWGAFDRDNNRQVLNQIPFADLKSLIDPSTPDVTGHVIEAFGRAGLGKEFEPIERAVQFLVNTQEDDGSWFGRWGVNYVYGTGAVLSGLAAVGEEMEQPYVERACVFLHRTQNPDGGWGESCASYEKGRYVPLNHSTPSQTAWALIGLMSSPHADEAALRKGIDYLLEKQKADGGWDEPEWTGTGFPRHFYLRYDYYRLYFPLLALGRFAARSVRRSRRKSSATA
jgi:squalene-hopene/tetraprenyl-beta-curcumene cyclase